MGYEPVEGGDQIMVSMSQISLATASERIPGVGSEPTGLTQDDMKALAYGLDAKVTPLKGVK